MRKGNYPMPRNDGANAANARHGTRPDAARAKKQRGTMGHKNCGGGGKTIVIT